MLGIHGGVEWLKRAPDADLDAHLGQKSLVQLRLMRDRFYDQPKIRERIARQFPEYTLSSSVSCRAGARLYQVWDKLWDTK